MLTIYSDKIVLNDKIFDGYIQIKDGIIQNLSKQRPNQDGIIDLKGQYIMSGIINISSNNIDKKEMSNIDSKSFIKSIKNIEYGYASYGVSTLYHSIYLSQSDEIIEEKSETENLIDLIKKYDSSKLSIIDNRTHLKFQIDSAKTMEDVKNLLDKEEIDFVSYDIKPSHKQENIYKDLYIQNFLQDKLELTEDMAYKVIQRIRDLRADANIDELAYLIKYAHFKGVKVCTSQYSSASKIYNEFKDTTDIIKLTTENKDEKFEKDMYFKLINTSKILKYDKLSLIDESSIISADKKPHDIINIIELMIKDYNMYEISRILSENPAKALGLNDKGVIQEGYVADIIALKSVDDNIVVTKMIKNGIEKFSVNI